MTTYKRVEYKAQFSSLNLLQIRQSDISIYRFHSKVSFNINGFPYELLDGENKCLGVGIKRLFDTITVDKLQYIYARVFNQINTQRVRAIA